MNDSVSCGEVVYNYFLAIFTYVINWTIFSTIFPFNSDFHKSITDVLQSEKILQCMAQWKPFLHHQPRRTNRTGVPTKSTCHHSMSLIWSLSVSHYQMLKST